MHGQYSYSNTYYLVPIPYECVMEGKSGQSGLYSVILSSNRTHRNPMERPRARTQGKIYQNLSLPHPGRDLANLTP